MIHLIGAGGHGKVVLDALLESGVEPDAVRVRDGRPDREGEAFLNVIIDTPEIDEVLVGQDVHITVGDAAVRARLFVQAQAVGARVRTILHPAAQVSRFATLGDGAFIAAMAVVGPSVVLGRSVIVNHGAVVDHDCRVGDFSHVAPQAALGGGVRIGARCLIGAGAVVLPGVVIGDDVILGAGAVAARDIASNQTWTGVPATPKDAS